MAATGIHDATSVEVSNYSTCAVVSTGGIECWGDDYDGELGNGYAGIIGNGTTATYSDVPTSVLAPT